MSAPSSMCVDCATSIIGDRPLCPACHDRHARQLVVSNVDAAPRLARSEWTSAAVKILVTWFVTVQTVAIVAALLFLAGRGCT